MGMTDVTLAGTRIRAGVWQGLLTGPAEMPQIEVMHLERSIGGVEVSEVAGKSAHWAVKVPIPVDLIADGVQTFLIRDRASQTTLAHFTLIAGAGLEADIRGEIDLLRAELDLLKRAFRRHCLEGAG